MAQTQTSEKVQENVFQVLRGMRDVGMDKVAKVVLTVTSSHPYSRVTSAVAKPSLFLLAVARRRGDAWMKRTLERLNMPSRSDILALSTRLTHIEVTLDDLGAAVDQLRTAAKPPKRSLTAARPNHSAAEG